MIGWQATALEVAMFSLGVAWAHNNISQRRGSDTLTCF
jgi:hypothetical protein